MATRKPDKKASMSDTIARYTERGGSRVESEGTAYPFNVEEGAFQTCYPVYCRMLLSLCSVGRSIAALRYASSLIGVKQNCYAHPLRRCLANMDPCRQLNEVS